MSTLLPPSICAIYCTLSSILQIGELSGGLSAEYRQATADRVQWGPMKAMRNLVVHNYGRMDQAIIWETAPVSHIIVNPTTEQENRTSSDS
ncbi:MAG: HepT-like ribonuclease domain-containing protein [Oscillospiraceae bacterium]